MALHSVKTRDQVRRSDIHTTTRLVLETAQLPLGTYYIEQCHSERPIFSRINLPTVTSNCEPDEVRESGQQSSDG